jgi:hypothetical protein
MNVPDPALKKKMLERANAPHPPFPNSVRPQEKDDQIVIEALSYLTQSGANGKNGRWEYDGLPDDVAIYYDPGRVTVRKWAAPKIRGIAEWDVMFTASGIWVEFKVQV